MVLIIDDHRATCHALERLLRLVGVDARCITESADAAKYMHEHKPAVVILDQRMPDKSGLDVFKEMKSDDLLKDVPVLFYSAEQEGADRNEAMNLGAAGWLTKGEAKWTDVIENVVALSQVN